MILKRLYELAGRENLLANPAFDAAPIACVVNLAADGRYLGLKDLRQSRTIAPKKKGGKPKTVLDRGKLIPVPVRPVVAVSAADPKGRGWKMTDPAVNGVEKPCVFLADTLARVLPIHDLIPADQRAKFDAQRSTFWRFLTYAAQQTQDPALKAIEKFGEAMRADPAIAARLSADVTEMGLAISQLCTFSWGPDEGVAVLERGPVRDWWAQFYQQDVQTQDGAAFQGLCQVTQAISPLPSSVKLRIGGLVSIGCRAEAYLLAPLSSAESYNLEGAATAMVSDRAIDGFTRALNALIGNSLPGLPNAPSPRSSIRMAGTMFLFWAMHQADANEFVDLLDSPSPEDIERFLGSALRGQESTLSQVNDFFCLTLSGNSARVVVRDYLEEPLPTARRNFAAWFRDLRIVDMYKNEIRSAFPLWMLAAATVRDPGDVAPAVPTQLLGAALKRDPIPAHILAGCIRRLHVEGAEGFRPARMALMKLALNRSNLDGGLMTETLDPSRRTPAYLCGRLLAVFERLQYFALGDVNATVVDRYYGTASTAPALVFPRLFKSAEQHLGKVHGEAPGQATNLQKDIEALSVGLNAFPALLTLAQQGEFALGFYHQRAEYRSASAERKQRKAAEAEAKQAATT